MKINLKRFLRQVHYWLSLAIIIPAGIIFFAGTLLMVKKDFAWIQPPSSKGAVIDELPAISFEDMLSAGQIDAAVGINAWSDIDRIDLRPGKGIAKIRAKSGWEVQLDTATGDVLNVAYRRSDMIEAIHDGSFFSKGVKRYIFLPTAILLIIMWATGIYLFFLPRLRKRRKK